MIRTLLCLTFVLAACGDNDPDYDLYEHEPDSFTTVSVWVDPYPEADVGVSLDACEAWRPEGILCASAASSQEALIRIHPSMAPCEELEDGNYPLAVAYEGGDIYLQIACLHKFGGTPVRTDLLWPVIGHEVGHELGIWTHVDPKDGVALMNPMIHEALFGITPIDHQAYLERDESRAVIRLAPEICVLTAR